LNEDYWAKALKQRVSRRRGLAVAGTAVAGAAALSLVGCGGKDNSSGRESQPSAVNKPVDTTKSAVQGGNFSDRIATDDNYYLYDSNFNTSGNPGIAGWVYSHFVKSKLGSVANLPNGSVEGDFAESFEVSPDGLRATFKVRPGVKWDPRPPTNGRIADSGDMVWSYNHWAAGNARRQFLVNSINPDAPVLSVATPDKNTFVMNLAFPYAPMLNLLAVNPYPLVMPVEAEGFNTRNMSRGSGAWISDEHQQSNFIRMRRNPDWYEKPRPFLDTYTMHVVPDYAAGLAQFKAGALDSFPVTQEDILATKREALSLLLSQAAKWRNNPGSWMFFGFREGSPFRDERVRRAVSMSIDRDTWLEVFSNKEKFAAAGLPVETTWFSYLGKGYPDIYLDPKKNELGEASKNFVFDPKEAKKLLTAAGYNSPIKATWSVPDINQGNMPESIRGGIAGLGDFDLGKVDVLNYNGEFNPKVRESKGNFEGMAYVGWGENADPDHTIGGIFAPNAAPNWQIGLGEDKHLTDLVMGQARATDRNKRVDLLKEVQRYLASKMYAIPGPGDFLTFRLSQPWISNFDYFVPFIVDPANANTSQLDFTYRWIDKSKRPA
jgi:peptide/nickel transport system substrate-binding protein